MSHLAGQGSKYYDALSGCGARADFGRRGGGIGRVYSEACGIPQPAQRANIGTATLHGGLRGGLTILKGMVRLWKLGIQRLA